LVTEILAKDSPKESELLVRKEMVRLFPDDFEHIAGE
jgi:hypothetical protein